MIPRFKYLCLIFFLVAPPALSFDAKKVLDLNGAAQSFYQKGELDRAKDNYVEALQELIKKDGKEIDIAKILSNLAVVERDMGESALANKHFSQSYLIKLKILGKNNPSTELTLKQWRKTPEYIFEKRKEKSNVTSEQERKEQPTSSNSISRIHFPPPSSERIAATPREYSGWSKLGGAIGPPENQVRFGPGEYSVTWRDRTQNFEEDSKSLAANYSLDWHFLAELRRTEHTLIETGSGALLSTPEHLDEQVWRNGSIIVLSKHPYLAFPAAKLTLIDGGQESAVIGVKIHAKN